MLFFIFNVFFTHVKQHGTTVAIYSILAFGFLLRSNFDISIGNDGGGSTQDVLALAVSHESLWYHFVLGSYVFFEFYTKYDLFVVFSPILATSTS